MFEDFEGECIYVEPDAPAGAPDDDIIDAEIVVP